MNPGNSFVEFVDVVKDFPGVRALDNVAFEISPGEIHAIVGENGAGKSTLMNLLAGNYPLSKGEIRVEGDRISFGSYADAVASGIHMVYQELSLADDLTVSENIFVGNEPTDSWGLINYRAMRSRSREILRELDISLSPDESVENLSIAQKQVVEIAKALRQQAKLLILDEPTSALPSKEVDELFRLLRRLRNAGTTIIYITHRLDEVFAISDRVTVLRDGKYVGTFETKAVSKDRVIRLEVGDERMMSEQRDQLRALPSSVLLDVQSLALPSTQSSVSFQLNAGEILGLFGLLGSGTKEVARCLCGLAAHCEGKVQLAGRRVRKRSFPEAMREGMGYLPPDRREEGLFLGLSIARNVVSASLRKYVRRGLLCHSAIQDDAVAWIRKLNITAPSHRQDVSTLSGGNQQKVCLAKWLLEDPMVLVADEPTAGIDVGAKFEIHGILRDFCSQGRAVLLVSSDIEEALRMCDRIVVMRDGVITGTLDRSSFSKEALLSLSL